MDLYGEVFFAKYYIAIRRFQLCRNDAIDWLCERLKCFIQQEINCFFYFIGNQIFPENQICCIL